MTKHKKRTDKNSSTNRKPVTNIHDLQEEELSGGAKKGTLDLSETDEDEDEGVGDGNIGKNVPDAFDK